MYYNKNMKIFNRNLLKIIALLTMLIDHIGVILFPQILALRIIGRISYPIFAFFIAEGFFYTKNKRKYFFIMLLFAIIAQPIYYFALNQTNLNILFTFIFSLIAIVLIKHLNKKIENYILLICYIAVVLILSLLNLIEYGFIGVSIPVILYFLKNYPKTKYIVLTILLLLLSILPSISGNFVQFASLLSLPLLLLYNGKKGKINLKYLFYVFYPTHLLILFLINLII